MLLLRFAVHVAYYQNLRKILKASAIIFNANVINNHLAVLLMSLISHISIELKPMTLVP